ncbi:unnamed protein product [Ilex paraguariensis]|uniref:Uncharacterized protein n=1 Tax=Ilex paraguariensis TaxID=185542 RepID=A0ABC8T4P2_9AQUA
MNCSALVEIDLSNGIELMDLATVAIAEAKNLERLWLARCKLISDIGVGCIAVGAQTSRRKEGNVEAEVIRVMAMVKVGEAEIRSSRLTIAKLLLCRVWFSRLELAGKVLNSNRWNVYKNLQLARKMEKLEKNISRFLQTTVQAHVHHLRFDSTKRFDRLEGSAQRLEQRLGVMEMGVHEGGWRKKRSGTRVIW